jgi:hypothetical protein
VGLLSMALCNLVPRRQSYYYSLLPRLPVREESKVIEELNHDPSRPNVKGRDRNRIVWCHEMSMSRERFGLLPRKVLECINHIPGI